MADTGASCQTVARYSRSYAVAWKTGCIIASALPHVQLRVHESSAWFAELSTTRMHGSVCGSPTMLAFLLRSLQTAMPNHDSGLYLHISIHNTWGADVHAFGGCIALVLLYMFSSLHHENCVCQLSPAPASPPAPPPPPRLGAPLAAKSSAGNEHLSRTIQRGKQKAKR